MIKAPEKTNSVSTAVPVFLQFNSGYVLVLPDWGKVLQSPI